MKFDLFALFFIQLIVVYGEMDVEIEATDKFIRSEHDVSVIR
jgi:hypothetical protein